MRLPDPEIIAFDLLNRVGQNGRPVNLDRLISLWPNLKISPENLEGEGYLIDLGERGAEIIVRAQDDEPRKRYTIAHELGHWVLHISGTQKSEEFSMIHRATIEQWCDQFAAAILMPKGWIIEDLREARIGGFINALRSSPHIYQVSHQSFRLRVSELTPVSIFELKQEGKDINIEHRYESSKAPLKPLYRTLDEVVSILLKRNGYDRHFHESTGLLSLCARISRSIEGRKWLVCVLPKPRTSREFQAKNQEKTNDSKYEISNSSSQILDK